MLQWDLKVPISPSNSRVGITVVIGHSLVMGGRAVVIGATLSMAIVVHRSTQTRLTRATLQLIELIKYALIHDV